MSSSIPYNFFLSEIFFCEIFLIQKQSMYKIYINNNNYIIINIIVYVIIISDLIIK